MKRTRAVLLASLVFTFIMLPAVSRTVALADRHGLQARSTVRSLHMDVRVRHILDAGTSPPPMRIAKDSRANTLYYLKANGDIYGVDLARSTSRLVYTSLQHHAKNPQGFAIGPTGTMYVVGNEDRPGVKTRATIVQGKLDAHGRRIWSVLAQTADYPKSNTAFDHRFNGIVVSPTGDHVYVNSGSRTDHGEIQAANGLFPGMREAGLTACILRLPTAGHNLFLPDSRTALKNSGYLYAEGTRNAFDLAFAPNGDLLATDNGPDRDMSDELNWLRSGGHYGFPWRIGGADNPQQFPDYDPSQDRLLDPRFYAVQNGYYHNDPDFPPRPLIRLIEPVANVGPDADSYRDPRDGLVKDASAAGRTLRTFTAHRSPLGLVFDTARAMSPEYNGSGFMLSWTPGDPNGNSVAGPFNDASQDLAHLTLRKSTSGTYTVRTVRIVEGFSNPIDAEIIGHKIFVLEYGGSGGLWEIVMPPYRATGI